MIRTGSEYKDSIRGTREVYVNGERVKDVTAHPMFKPLVDTPATRNAIGAREIVLLPPHACLVNIGRAPVVDYSPLATALKEGRLSGAVLDVFDEEPLPESSDLWYVPNLIITPHTSCDDHHNYIDRCLSIFAGNVERFSKGFPLENVVDAAHQY